MNRTVFLSRKDHDRTVPWSPGTCLVALAAKRSDSLAGFTYVFPSEHLAQEFRACLGILGDE